MHIRNHGQQPASPEDRVFEVAADLFGLLAAPTRLRIVCVLIEGEKNVTELLERVAVNQPNMSQHLATLYRSGVLARRRTGAQIFYRIANAQVQRLCQALQAQGSLAAAGPGGAVTPLPEEQP
ncbi:MAG: metalloregulator ArsR/SmtB family transcription factor [Pseudomonadota bacterium]